MGPFVAPSDVAGYESLLRDVILGGLVCAAILRLWFRALK